MTCTWQESRTFSASPVSIARRLRSASWISPGSPASTSTRQVVHLALPPQRCSMSIPASSMASTSLRPCSASKACSPVAVSASILGIGFYAPPGSFDWKAVPETLAHLARPSKGRERPCSHKRQFHEERALDRVVIVGLYFAEAERAVHLDG